MSFAHKMNDDEKQKIQKKISILISFSNKKNPSKKFCFVCSKNFSLIHDRMKKMNFEFVAMLERDNFRGCAVGIEGSKNG